MPTSTTTPEETKITYLNAALLSTTVVSVISELMKMEKIRTPIVPNNAPTRPRPPSKNPKALPCELAPPQTRVAFIIAAQNKKMVVKPQYPYKILSTK